MFDFNGDGQVEYEEFAKVQNAILAQTSHGRKLGKSNRYKGLSSAVSRYFFGENLDRRLSIDEFVRFQESLQKELLMLEVCIDPRSSKKLSNFCFSLSQ